MAENNTEINSSDNTGRIEYLAHEHRYTTKIVDIPVDPADLKSQEALADVRAILREAQKKDTNNAPDLAAAIDAAKAADPRVYEAVKAALEPELYKVKMEEQPLLRTAAGESGGLLKRMGGRIKSLFNRIRGPKSSDTVVIPEPDGVSKFAVEAMNTTNNPEFRKHAQQTAVDVLQKRNKARMREVRDGKMSSSSSTDIIK